MTTTSAVIVHTMTVSMKGSSRATTPSRTGSSVEAAECAMEAEPTPASFENDARWKPTISAPMMPPPAASRPKAWLMMLWKAGTTSPALSTMMYSAAATYTPHITGTIRLAAWPMRRIPPRITMATHTAMSTPKSHDGNTVPPSLTR